MYLLIILLLVLVIFGYPMLRIYLALRAARRRFNNMFGEQQTRHTGPKSRQGRQRRSKIISRDIGEYIEFEELPGKVETTSTITSYTEISQIEDAEWEEVI